MWSTIRGFTKVNKILAPQTGTQKSILQTSSNRGLGIQLAMWLIVLETCYCSCNTQWQIYRKLWHTTQSQTSSNLWPAGNSHHTRDDVTVTLRRSVREDGSRVRLPSVGTALAGGARGKTGEAVSGGGIWWFAVVRSASAIRCWALAPLSRCSRDRVEAIGMRATKIICIMLSRLQSPKSDHDFCEGFANVEWQRLFKVSFDNAWTEYSFWTRTQYIKGGMGIFREVPDSNTQNESEC